MQRKTPWILAAVLAAGGGAALAQQAPVDLSAERRGLMRQQLQAVRAIQPVVQNGGDPRSVQPQAESLVTTGQRKLTLFPPGSDRDDVCARPEIWSDRTAFERAGANLIEQARRLAMASAAGDRAAFAEAFQASNAACSGCHQRFQLPQRQ